MSERTITQRDMHTATGSFRIFLPAGKWVRLSSLLFGLVCLLLWGSVWAVSAARSHSGRHAAARVEK